MGTIAMKVLEVGGIILDYGPREGCGLRKESWEGLTFKGRAEKQKPLVQAEKAPSRR